MDAVHSELERLGKSRKSGAVNYLLNKTSVEYGGWSFTSINTLSSRQIKDLLYFRLHRFYAAFFNKIWGPPISLKNMGVGMQT